MIITSKYWTKILNEHVKDKEDLKEKIDSAINELKIQLKYQADRNHIRARAKWIEESEKNTSYIIEKVEMDGKFTENESETLGTKAHYVRVITPAELVGLTPSWYRQFWYKIGYFLMNVFNPLF